VLPDTPPQASSILAYVIYLIKFLLFNVFIFFCINKTIKTKVWLQLHLKTLMNINFFK